jgi:class 3 adenylate cyclase/tetratricopeptide (TPR) repeat protein
MLATSLSLSFWRDCGKHDVMEAMGSEESSVAPAQPDIRHRHEQRKTVTVVFCDLADSTALGEGVDPEALRALLVRYSERMKGIVESHGGTVEKFIGDAVMAVFGVPVAHEDDALRAVRAAVEMRDALPELGVQGRIGVNTGEVVTGTAERLVTGDPVNVAQRLQAAAAAGEVLIGRGTFALVSGASDVEALEPLSLKGKASPVTAYRLISVHAQAERQRVRMVGRQRELRRLEDAFAQSMDDLSCQLFTILGAAGVGKSRLVEEFVRTAEAPVVQGRCLSYGEGITYWPVVEVIKQLDAAPEDEYFAGAIHSLLGESEQPASTSEIAAAFRKLLEEQARERPLVCVFDDLHWGEETFLNLVEHVADLARGAPILLLCMARPDLLDRRPGWGGGKLNATTVLLESLNPTETAELIDAIGGANPDTKRRVADASEGNPLFVEEMLTLSRESGSEVSLPPTIRAVIAARLDQLNSGERQTLEAGAVEGRVFHRGAVESLTGDANVSEHLAALVRKELLRPDKPQVLADEAYRVRHQLIRDAAYEGVPKATRADLHRRFAGWLEAHGQGLVELDELLGYHLEQAAQYLAELGQPDPELALAAGDHLGVAGKRAARRADIHAAASLLERALELTRPYRLDVHLEIDLVGSLGVTDLAQAAEIADAAAARAEAAGDQVATALVRTVAANVRIWAGQGSTEELERIARSALPLLEAAGDDEGLAYVWSALGQVANMRARLDEWAQAAEQAIVHARAGGPDTRLFGLGVALQFGPRPAGEALEALDAVLPEQPHPATLTLRAGLLAMLDRIEEAWAAALPANERARELGIDEQEDLAEIAALAGDDKAAAAYLRAACDRMEASGRRGHLASYAPRLGRLLCALGRHDEAEPLAQKGRELTDPDDVAAQASWRQTQALVYAARAQHAEAERLAREAVSWAKRSDSPVFQGDALNDLAQVLEAAGRRDEAIAAWQEALKRYDAKQIIPLARRVREQLAAIQPRQA